MSHVRSPLGPVLTEKCSVLTVNGSAAAGDAANRSAATAMQPAASREPIERLRVIAPYPPRRV